ncbi:MAG: PEP-CTERM sorting domain-containing protein [Verrucomicrobiota bacterium]|nr:PEP-CTERM sorting domain-containing protein [Limisphaera sp.]MDW8381955.1 PEP-CTERM sorting domain-containing protein [Verrucomicrobiota bacterium]
MKIRDLVLSAVLIIAPTAFAQFPIVYVDITDGPTGNTMQFTNGVWGIFEGVSQTATANDGLWDERAFGNFSTIFQNSGVTAVVDTNAPRLRTTITVPEPLPGQYYNVYVLFWSDPSQWRVGASLTDDPGQLPLYMPSTSGVTQFYSGADATVFSDTLSTNPFTTAVMIAEGNRRLYMTPSLGQVTGSTITVYMEPDRNQQNANQRTWLDGIGYQLVPEPSAAALMGLGVLWLLWRSRWTRAT